MKDNQAKKYKNSFHVRIYDVELLKSLNELYETGQYESMNVLINHALSIGIEKIYLEFGKLKLLMQPPMPDQPIWKRLEKIEDGLAREKLLQEDMFILMNSIEALAASIYNVQRMTLNGEAVNGELLDSGYMTALPPAYQEIKDNLVARFNRKLSKEKKSNESNL